MGIEDEAFNFESGEETYQVDAPPKVEKEFNFDNNYWDFSFKPVVEELQKTEEEFKKKFANQQVKHESTLAEYKHKLETLHDLIMPLLVNLTRDPDKTYISWPSRAEKVKAFIDKINALMEE
ncbi:MAG: hypothetical protein P4L79_10810 [Legionella sp.]|uniref:hypothetical protein n=1 Tax=Legionella sp. TaxID=459 RepID=UPI00283BD8C4|nr:hypothetical protein [Legionella sp.]